jgi:hypothetical protein
MRDGLKGKKQMEKWVLIIESNCKDETRDHEFNDWYDNIHIPDILQGSTGFKGATRYSITKKTEGKGKYIVVYEIMTNNIVETLKAHAKNMENKMEIGRWSDLLDTISRQLCRVEQFSIKGYPLGSLKD